MRGIEACNVAARTRFIRTPRPPPPPAPTLSVLPFAIEGDVIPVQPEVTPDAELGCRRARAVRVGLGQQLGQRLGVKIWVRVCGLVSGGRRPTVHAGRRAGTLFGTHPARPLHPLACRVVTPVHVARNPRHMVGTDK